MALEASAPASRVDIIGALRQAAITGLITFGLLLPLIGFNTVQNIRNELILETRWLIRDHADSVALTDLVALVTGGRANGAVE